MSTFIDLDSMWRRRDIYPNENKYQLEPKQVDTWFRSARSVRAHPQNPNIQPLEFATTVNIRLLTLPYSENVAELPRIYVNFYSRLYKDIHLINAIDGKQPTAKFICLFHRIQNDRNGNPLWIHYQCNMEQTMRFKRSDTIAFELTTRDGTTLPQLDNPSDQPADPTKQTLCTFELTPFIRDGDYNNAMVETKTN